MTAEARSCSACGAELPSSARFCRACGAPQEADTEGRGEATDETAARAQPRPTIAAPSHFPIGRLLLVLAVGGVIAYFAITGGGSESPQTIEQRIESVTGRSVTDCESSSTAVNFRCNGSRGPHCYMLTHRDGSMFDLDGAFDLRQRQDAGDEIDYGDFGIEDQGKPVPVTIGGQTQDLCPGF